MIPSSSHPSSRGLPELVANQPIDGPGNDGFCNACTIFPAWLHWVIEAQAGERWIRGVVVEVG